MPYLRFLLGAGLALTLSASEHRGRVQFAGVAVPGATVTASQGDRRVSAITGPEGIYTLHDLADGVWTVQVEMLCFKTETRSVTMAPDAPSDQWDLKLLPVTELKQAVGAQESAPRASLPAQTAQTAAGPPATAKTRKGVPPPANTPGGFQRADLNAIAPLSANPASEAESSTKATIENSPPVEASQLAGDGFLLNGAANNGASSPFSLAAAFGNNRRGPGSPYNGSMGMILDNSALDARPFSLTGQDTQKPAYNHITGLLSFGGPLKIPHWFSNGPNLIVNYQWTRNRNANTQSALVPTSAERNGDLSQLFNLRGAGSSILDPTTGLPFAGNVIPQNRIAQPARNLLGLYPLPNLDGNAVYNYQISLLGATHQDTLQSRVNKTLGRKDQLSGNFAFQSIRADSPNLFQFLDTTDTFGLNSGINWRHSFTPHFYGTAGYQFSRLSLRTKPYFENRVNVSGQAGISGNNQDAVNWGPPNLTFAGGIAGLSASQSSFARNRTGAVSYDMLWSRNRHNLTFGTDFKRLELNLLAQQDARGTLTFTGAATGSDFAGFLLGVPDTSAIAFGNADKYLRSSAYDAFITDDWRLSPGFTLNAGIRWEYGSPITELYGRLVNLDIASGFTAVSPVVASNPTGSLTGKRYPDSLVHSDKHGFQPRVAISWRPLPASSLVVRAGYGVYYNTSVYQMIALQMSQQPPLSKSFSVRNSPLTPLSLANGFDVSGALARNTFAIDPNFLVGYSQNWQLSIQRDLPAALVMTATYLGIKGTRGIQEFLPNTFPAGDPNACTQCPNGYAYLSSNGNSTREAAQIQLRRRLHNGFTASLQYVYSKSIDDAALGGRNQGGNVIAQDWLNLRGERALSNFDQRHLLTFQTQYSTGMGIHGGTLLSGWRGALFKEWNFSTQVNAGSGLPLTPVYLAAVAGTGVTGSLRPDYTGAPVHDAPPGLFLNPAAYSPPAPGRWGTAGRNSITGPSQFTLGASMGRTFRMSDRRTLDLRIDSANTLNHVTFPAWNTTITSAQFGAPVAANAMRSVQTIFRFRF